MPNDIIFSKIVEEQRHGRRCVLVTVVATQGSTPRKAGARMLVTQDHQQIGTIGGGSVEHALAPVIERVFTSAVAEQITFKLTSELAMCCGGQMTFFVELLVAPPPLLIFGCGHVGTALVEVAASLDFATVAIDDMSENLTEDIRQRCRTVIESYDPHVLSSALQFTKATMIVIATREHSLDQRLLEFCLPQTWAFLGVIGSERKALMQIERLRTKGFDETRISQIHCPIGLAIGAQSPQEIAVAIAAQLIAQRAGVAI